MYTTIDRLRVAAHWLALLLLGLGGPALALEGAAPSVKDLVEFTRIIQPLDGDPDAMRALVSPDGTKAFIVTRKADVATDDNVFEIVLMDVRPERLSARRAEPARTVLSVRARKDEDYANPAIQQVRWADNRTLVLLARLADALPQVYRLDVVTSEVTALTAAVNRVASFAVSRDFRRVVYAAQMPNPPLAEGARSIVLGNQSFWAVKFGQHDERSQDRIYRYFVADSGSGLPPRPIGEAFAPGNSGQPSSNVSPDGRWAVLPRYDLGQQLSWANQYPLVGQLMRRLGRSASIDPLSYFSRPSGFVARRLVAYRLDDGHEQMVLDAPDDASPAGQGREDRLWQGDERSVVLAGTHLPLRVGEKSFGSGSHIVEYWPDTGRWEVVAALAGRLQRAYALGENGFGVVDGQRHRRFERRTGGRWQELDLSARAAARERDRWTLHLDEALNKPPEIVATLAGGQSVPLTSLNPQFTAEDWGTMRPHTWHDVNGRRWEGGLMTGRALKPGARHPLVIQTYGFTPSRFYLDGPNPSIGFTSGFAGRAFLREGIVVLAMPWNSSSGMPTTEREATLAFVDGVRAAIDSLVTAGMVDPARVGIIGWSATGERILNLVTFSDVPIRAATIADGDANTQFTIAISYGASDAMWTHLELVNEGLPFGESWERWVRNDPALHTECVTAAMRIESYGPWVLPGWDTYALLRRQYKPAEMVLIPGGTHALSRPSERMISLQGNVDWYRFWLKREERTDISLAGETAKSLEAQYVRWRQMETLKKEERGPRCARPAIAR